MASHQTHVESPHLQLRINWTWFILALLVIWTLATGYFPAYDLSFSTATYWLMGLGAVLGLFISIVLHESCHSMMARRYRLGGKKITLFIFGGVSDLEKEPANPGAEFWIAVVGPVFSGLLGLAFAMIDGYGLAQGWPDPVTDVLYYLSSFNYIIAIFNLVPAFPLDGGRIFRSILWAWKKDIKWATKIASDFGVGFGLIMVAFGLFQVLTFNLFNGIWMFFLGMFLVAMARGSYAQLLMARLLAHEPVEHAMKHDTFSVSPETSLKELVDDVYKYHSKVFPVTDGAKLLGSVGIKDLRKVSEWQWPQHKVSEFTTSCTSENIISPKDDVIQAMTVLNKSKSDELIVAEDGKLVGRISLKDILEFFNLKLELEEGRLI